MFENRCKLLRRYQVLSDCLHGFLLLLLGINVGELRVEHESNLDDLKLDFSVRVVLNFCGLGVFLFFLYKHSGELGGGFEREVQFATEYDSKLVESNGLVGDKTRTKKFLVDLVDVNSFDLLKPRNSL